MKKLTDNNEQHRNNMRLNSTDLGEDIINSLIGFHAFSRNDYIIAFL